MSLGRNLPHDAAVTHVSGESEYIDDRLPMKNEVFVAYIGSPVARGELLEVNDDQAQSISGYLGMLRAQDVHHNLWGSIFKDQPLLVDRVIGYYDEPVAIIAAESREALRQAKKMIEVKVREETPVLDFREAISQKQFLYSAVPFVRGNVDEVLAKSDYKLKGSFMSGGQEHFYLENQAAVVYPLENGHLEVHSSSQHPTETQHLVAEACGLSFHQVSCIVKRMGGGFGGKESQAAPIAAYAALFAQKLRRPARMVLSKDEDMQLTGKRHPFLTNYEVAFTEQGEIRALKAELFADGGAYSDLSSSILERAMFHIDGAYYLDQVNISGHVVKTNTPSNTAFRGFGGPQGTLVIESLIEDIAEELGLDPLTVRERNCYQTTERNKTPYNQVVENNVLPELFSNLKEKTRYQERRLQIEDFNRRHSEWKKGLSMTATKFGIAFTARHLNQGSALVHLHRDGSLQVSSGATEMGQGVNTKIAQIVANAFGVSVSSVKVLSTSTERNANTSPTAASSGSDINGAAALKACNQIQRRLCSVAHAMLEQRVPTGGGELQGELPANCKLEEFSFAEGKIHYQGAAVPLLQVIETAYFHRVSLSEFAHFKTEGLGFDKKKVEGKAFNYFTNGVVLSEVMLNSDTGELKVLSTEILMDIGESLNEGIDRGQITGAFVQGMGWLTSENLVTNAKGQLLTHSPTTYKIPNIQDTPRKFTVELFPNSTTHMNVHRSKAVGEPPFLLGISVFTAIKNALSYRQKGLSRKLMAPATPEKYLLLFAEGKGR